MLGIGEQIVRKGRDATSVSAVGSTVASAVAPAGPLTVSGNWDTSSGSKGKAASAAPATASSATAATTPDWNASTGTDGTEEVVAGVREERSLLGL